MKFKNKVSIFCVVVTVFFASLQSKTQVTNEGLDAHKRLIEFEEGCVIASFLDLSRAAHENYLEKNKIEPHIECKKCTTKLLSLHELRVGLFAWALKDGGGGKVSFEKIKSILYGCLKIIYAGSPADIIDYMVQASNETKQFCSDCHDYRDSWGKTA